MNGETDKTPLYEWHRDHGGRLVDFAGWSMPVQYTSIVDEHAATRNSVGVFDIGHMGRLRFDGPGAAAFLDRLLTRRVVDLIPGKIRYSLVTNQAGGILDDVLVYYLHDRNGQAFHLLVVNAGNRQKIVDWIQGHVSDSDQVTVSDETRTTSMIAVQGPRALEAAQPLVATTLAEMPYYTGTVTTIAGLVGVVSRTGYTGEDGCELIIPAESSVDIWEAILTASQELGGKPAGLGARDTLRLEAAMPLYGHELDETLDPYTAGLGFAVQLKDREFIGRTALAARKDQARKDQTRQDQTQCAQDTLRERVGLVLAGKRVARQHYDVKLDEDRVGQVTSGTFSPTLQRPIAMAYVEPRAATVGTRLDVDIRGRREIAQVVELPFYRRSTT